MKASGGCLCGAVRYEIDGEPLFMGVCHCRDCQKATGAGHAPGMSFRRKQVRITGETRTFAVPGSSGQPMPRHFCPTCGSLLFTEPATLPGMINVTAGTLDDPSLFQPQAAIYTRDRQAWDHLQGSLAEYETVPVRARG